MRSFIIRSLHQKLHRARGIRCLRVWEIKNASRPSSHTEYIAKTDGKKGWRKMESKWQYRFVKPTILSYFLPHGFPDSVSPSYLSFARYSFVASVSSATSMVLSTQALLLAIGVGSTHAPPIAGAINWILKDGFGQLGGVFFASKIGSSSLTIDSDPKRWRIISALALDTATLLETLCPLFPHYFLPLASIANISKNIGFLTASASRASIHQALVKSDNLGDVTAKAGSQSTAASLIGTSMGVILSPFLGNDTVHTVLLVLTLSCIHILFTHESLRFISLTCFNRSRLDLLLQQYSKISLLENPSVVDYNCLSPDSISQLESIWPFTFSFYDSKDWLQVGCTLNEICPDGIEQLKFLRGLVPDYEKYIISCTWNYDTEGSLIESTIGIKLTFLEDATSRDILRGFTHAHVLSVCSNKHLWLHIKGYDESLMISQSYNIMKTNFDTLLFALSNHGWNVHGFQFKAIEGAFAVRLRIDIDANNSYHLR